MCLKVERASAILSSKWFVHFPTDIHAVVKEIATTNNVDLFKIRYMMLEKWICKTGPAVTKVSPSEQSFILVSLCFPITCLNCVFTPSGH